MAYLALAYPEISRSDYQIIQDYRKVNDALYFDIAEPHFTIVFPVFDFTEVDFISEIKKRAKGLSSFNFSLRCATINKDAFNEYYHTFLVPDEGYSNIVKMHDKLYSDALAKNLRLDLDFVPHIGVGNSTDKHQCKAMVDEWNAIDFEINGKISSLTIVEFDNDKIKKLEEIEIKK